MYAVKKPWNLNLGAKESKPLKNMIMEKKTSAKYAGYGCQGARKTIVLRSTPCALIAWWNLMQAIQMETQVNNEAMVVRFWNQIKTVLAPALVDMNVRSPTDPVIKTQ